MTTGSINEEVLKKYFAEAGFPVKEFSIADNICRMEYNYPDEDRAVAMRLAFCRNGADVDTYYRHQALNESMGQLLSRERVSLPFETHEGLRDAFNTILDDYNTMTANLDSSGVKRGQPGTPINPISPRGGEQSSFRPERRTRPVLGRW